MAMDCEDVGTLLGSYADGELRPPHKATLAAHLHYCPECAARLAAIQELGELARKLTVPEPPANLWDRIVAVIDSPVQKPVFAGNRRKWLRLATVAALVLLAVYTGWLAHGPTPPNAPEPRTGEVVVDLGPFLDKGIPVQFAGADGVSFVTASLTNAGQQVNFRLFDQAKLAEDYTAGHCMVGRCGGHRLVQTEYRRAGEGCLLLQYPRALPVAFGNRPIETLQVSGKSITVVQGKTCWAASWEAQGTVMTILGPRDRSELLRLVASVDRTLEGKKS